MKEISLKEDLKKKERKKENILEQKAKELMKETHKFFSCN